MPAYHSVPEFVMFNNNQAPTTHPAPRATDAPITRNGSAILIVVGTLALIAVFAAIYISIGQSDQRVARSIENKVEIETNANTIADHVLDVLAKDRLAFTTQRNGAGVFAVRDAIDTTYTDWTMRSESNNEWEWFNPAGLHSSLGTQPGLAQDFRVASDPWLAATSPTYLGNPGRPQLSATDDRPFASLITNAQDFIANVYSSGFLDKRDWLQISNLAPDGRFVNLFNLRAGTAQSNGFGDNNFGGFDSESGTGTFTRPSDGRTVRRMSQYLSLWDQEDPGDPESRIITFDPMDGNKVWIPGRNEPVDIGLSAADIQNTPAVWTMYQRFMFQPINQPFMTVNRNNQISTWADPDYAPYQYADADGDGMADSRWIELTSAQDTQSSSTNPREDIERLYDAGNTRIFAAIRVMDLSSLVNVNTAMEQLTEPDPVDGGTLGYTPADVDLRRLLSLTDVGHNYSILQLAGLSPSSFHKPTLTSNNDLHDPDYKWYRNYIDPASTIFKVIEPSSNALSIGRYAYSAIKLGIEEGGTLDDRYTAWPPVLREMNDASPPDAVAVSDFDDTFNPPNAEYDPSDATYRLKQYHRDPINPSTDPMTEKQRSEWYMNIGRLNPLTTDQVKTSQGYAATGSLYNKDDLLELLAFHGLNDPATVSRLEKSAMGRMPSIFGQNQRAFSPLMSNRPLSLDRERHGYNDESAYVIAPTDQPRKITGSIAKESMVFFSVSPRRLLTTVSGGTAILPGSVVNPTLPTLTAAEAAPTLGSALASPKTLFSIYSNALTGELELNKLSPQSIDDVFIEDPTQAQDEETATLFYGYRGPELALHVAAHTAVNEADLFDIDTKPTVGTLLMDNSLRDEFEDTGNFPTDEFMLDPADAIYRRYPGAASANLLDRGEFSLPGAQPGTQHFNDEHRQVVNVFGIEPMPILTETVSFYVYHDTSESAGGDSDYGAQRPRIRNGLPSFIPIPGAQTKITINPSTDPSTNIDCLMQGIAFQLTNPWDTEISLGGDRIPNGPSLSEGSPLTRQRDLNDQNLIDTTSNFQFDYYIEWNGYFFKLAEYAQYYPPSSSRYDLRDQDESITGARNPSDDYGPNDGASTENGGPMNAIDYPDFVARNVTLQPGESRVFYAVADPEFDATTDPDKPEWVLDKKWRNAMASSGGLPLQFTDVINYDSSPLRDQDGLIDGTDRRGWTGPAKEWVQNQFNTSDSRLPVMIHPMNPQTGEYGKEDILYDYLNTPLDHVSPAQFNGNGFDQISSSSTRRDASEVRLWRKIVTPAEETTDTRYVHAVKENLLHNDMLVDRMELTSGVATPIELLSLTNEVAKTVSFAEDYPNTVDEIATNVRNDNTGFSVVRWASTSRRDSVDTTEPGMGQIREWMLSSRLNPTESLVSATDEVMRYGDDSLTLDAGDFIESAADLDNATEPDGRIVAGRIDDIRTDYETHRTLRELFTHDSVLVTASLEPYKKSDLDTEAPNNGEDGSARKFNRSGDPNDPLDMTTALWAHPDGNSTLHVDGDFGVSNLRPELLTTSKSFNDAPRLADLLLAWGIGPAYAPTQAGSLSDTNAGYYPAEWMTLTEAIAIALGYESPNAADISADNIWADTFTPNAKLLDNGHLAIDNYVAYYNIDTNENPPEFTYDEDIRRGTGAPMALGVLDQARAIASLDTSADQLVTPTFGQININTAPVEVLRLLPGLSPILSSYYPTFTPPTSEPEWWGQNESWDLPDLSSASNTPDVAAAIVGYRDRLYVEPRFRSADIGGQQDYNPLNYASASADPDESNPLDNTEAHAHNLFDEEPTDILTDTDGDHRDRQTISGIDGMRQTPGFGSLGEIFAVSFGPDAKGAGNTPSSPVALRTAQPQLSIQQYFHDNLNLDGDDVELIAIDPQLFGGTKNGSTKDDYAERLAMANGILNMISVRSDYYAVWFVVHAYQESDVTNLQPEDPLIPSLAKRYVMVVDRSNVTDPGDTPKVVFLREVPM
tara:strand:+ start:336230 stop:342148 length:5919 start_codon:yes stop_codon:yes gene_type:complete